MDKNISMALVVVALLSGCSGITNPDDSSDRTNIEATVVESPPDSDVINYNSSKLDGKGAIREIVRKQVEAYNSRGDAVDSYSINSTTRENWESLESGYIEYKGVVVRLALEEAD